MSKRIIGYYYQNKQLWKIIRTNKQGFITCYKEIYKKDVYTQPEVIRNLPVLSNEGDFLLTCLYGKISYLNQEVKK